MRPGNSACPPGNRRNCGPSGSVDAVSSPRTSRHAASPCSRPCGAWPPCLRVVTGRPGRDRPRRSSGGASLPSSPSNWSLPATCSPASRPPTPRGKGVPHGGRWPGPTTGLPSWLRPYPSRRTPCGTPTARRGRRRNWSARSSTRSPTPVPGRGDGPSSTRAGGAPDGRGRRCGSTRSEVATPRSPTCACPPRTSPPTWRTGPPRCWGPPAGRRRGWRCGSRPPPPGNRPRMPHRGPSMLRTTPRGICGSASDPPRTPEPR